MDAAGWVPLPEFMACLDSDATEDAIRDVVQDCPKQRFVLGMTAAGQPAIRAAQGHSIPLEAPLLEAVDDAAAVPLAVHVTTPASWEVIQADGFLRRMHRTHIHFATAPALLRPGCSTALVLDLPAAMAAGHSFHRAANGVLLTEGPMPIIFVAPCPASTVPWPPAGSDPSAVSLSMSDTVSPVSDAVNPASDVSSFSREHPMLTREHPRWHVDVDSLLPSGWDADRSAVHHRLV
eukprot:CAMPEP_0206146498 /NCGR_PEP_ID=MMETSP1473-20131121/30502_1 /ASSEMBLY_ACC=CAM_ASM_001109 /TAXON_ID=1461547 /ORGANISM="Stichococcus sp, Strain RCC1054" /LENGTH=234 /DNA_ID=CAMNT_0053543069 /DNA_START=310 /DNA_END=1014 /DNA_ORIENTATION=+